MDETARVIRDAAELTFGVDESFAVVEVIDNPSAYLQWVTIGDAAHVEVADPTYNDEPAFELAQLDALAQLGFAEGEVNFERDLAPGEYDPRSLTDLVTSAFSTIFGVNDPALLKVTVEGA